MLVVAIGTMALIIVLSVFNGLEGLLRGLYGTVDANLVVAPAQGKTFEYTQDLRSLLSTAREVQHITEVLEDNALLRYNGAQRVAKVKGVSADFISEGRLDNYLVFGELKLMEGNVPYAIVGRGVQYDLSINPKNDFYTISMFYPNAKMAPGQVDPSKMYRFKSILPKGVFAIEKSYDENLVFVPVQFAEELFEKPGMRSTLELQLLAGTDVYALRDRLQQQLGDDFSILSNEELHGDLYRVLRWEKFFVFLTFSIIIGIASINIFFSLSMLAIDKKKDVAILSALGASKGLIRNIFLAEGCIVAFTGAFTGLLIGLSISLLQQEFGFVTMGMETAIMDAYPVKIEWLDVLFTVICLIVITTLTAIQPAISASKHIRLHEIQ